MAHPFKKMFETALKASTPMDNQVLEAAEKLKEKGYDEREIHDVLIDTAKGRIDDTDQEILDEAVDEFGRYLS